MNLKLVLAITLFCLLGMPGTTHAKYRNGWGWSKPLNAKQGAFYTTNRRFRKDLQAPSTRVQRYTPMPTQMYPQKRVISPSQRWSPTYGAPRILRWR